METTQQATLYHCTITRRVDVGGRNRLQEQTLRTLALHTPGDTECQVQHPDDAERWVTLPTWAVVFGAVAEPDDDSIAAVDEDAVGTWEYHRGEGWTFTPAHDLKSA